MQFETKWDLAGIRHKRGYVLQFVQWNKERSHLRIGGVQRQVSSEAFWTSIIKMRSLDAGFFSGGWCFYEFKVKIEIKAGLPVSTVVRLANNCSCFHSTIGKERCPYDSLDWLVCDSTCNDEHARIHTCSVWKHVLPFCLCVQTC